MSRYHVRCANSKCRVRQVLSKHPDNYLRPRRCWSCGDNRWNIDPFMTKRDTRAMGCMCGGYWWAGNMSGAMHRRGSKACFYRADGTHRMPGDPDFYDVEYNEVENETN